MNQKKEKGIKIIYKINSNIEEENIRLFGEHFYRENNSRCKILINQKKTDLTEFYNIKSIKGKELIIILLINEKLNDLNGMFCGCSTLYSVENLSNLDTLEVNDMSFMFYECSSLSFLSDISKWNTLKVNNMSFMFYNCSSLKQLNDLSNWNTSNVTDMSFMFYECSSLLSITGISKWNASNLVDMNSMFYNCKDLEQLPDISKWKFSEEANKENCFYGCSINKIDIFKIINGKNKNDNILEEKDDIINPSNYLENNDNCKVLMNDNLKFLPQIELKFKGDFNIENIMIKNFKNELSKLFGEDRFSLIEIRKRSFKVIITLQFIFKKVLDSIIENPAVNNILNFPNEINKEVIELAIKIKKNKFLCIGNAKPDFLLESVVDFTKTENQQKLMRLFNSYNNNKKENKTNIYEHSKNITINDLNNLINFLSDEADKQEINQFVKNFEEFFDNENEIEKNLLNSIFEYKIINIYLINKDNLYYKVNKEKCPNREIRLLYHGTLPKNFPPILLENFNCESEIHIIGEGTYFTDSFDYV